MEKLDNSIIKAVDVSEIEKLKTYGSVTFHNKDGDIETDFWISKAEVLALLDRSPSVSAPVR